MKFQYLLFAFTLDGLTDAYGQVPDRAERTPRPIHATCGDRQLARVSPETIDVRSGSATRSLRLADVQWIDVTGPVNRINGYAWATVKAASGAEQGVGIVLPHAGTLMLEGVDAQGKPDRIDVLACKRLEFKPG